VHELCKATGGVGLVGSEIEDWEKDLSTYAIEALKSRDKEFFPNIYVLLKLLATLLVSTESVERSFSTMIRLKTYLQNYSNDNRFNGLALMPIHHKILIDVERIIKL